jgi:S-adenosylmethionine:tRNA ribosyltransferase-isomerase
MVLRRATGTISHHVFSELPELLDDSYVIALNNSRVIKARLEGRDAAGKDVVIFLLKPVAEGTWCCLGDSMHLPPVGGAVTFPGSTLAATLQAIADDGTVVFRFSGVDDLMAEIERIGRMPLPPYIQDDAGEAQYQTVFAKEAGSVAAPTAGLHFTPDVFTGLDRRGVERAEVTLHVGYGTFARVTSEDLSGHAMHSESFSLSPETAAFLNDRRAQGKKLLSVGTTATRVLESCADDQGRLTARTGETSIFIHPPYRFKAIDALLTNFHMPGFTPIMLVAAFAGFELTREAYQVAIAERYRFYSFGDAMLVL